ncbi:hypothetical protein ACWA2C_30025 [Priestia megaterium]
MKKIKFGLITSLTLILIVSGYILVTKSHQSISSTTYNKDSSLYIDFVDEKLKHIVYEVNLKKFKEKNLLKKDLKDYPTSAYSKKDKILYFTEETRNKDQQLFQQELYKNMYKKRKQLTYNFNYVDFLRLDDHRNIIYMRVLLDSNDRDFHVAKMDLNTKEIKVFNKENKNNSVVWFDYNPKTQQLLMINKSIKEEAKNINLSNEKDQPLKAPKYTATIFKEKDNSTKRIFSAHKFIDSAALSPDGEKILFSWKNSIDPEASSTISLFDIQTKKEKVVLKDSKELINVHQPLYSKGGNGFYFIADLNKVIKNKTTNTQMHPSTIKFFDFNSNEIEDVWFKENGTPINIYL